MKKKVISVIRKTKEMGMEKLRCGVCHHIFRAASRFHRSCRTCLERMRDETSVPIIQLRAGTFHA